MKNDYEVIDRKDIQVGDIVTWEEGSCLDSGIMLLILKKCGVNRGYHEFKGMILKYSGGGYKRLGTITDWAWSEKAIAKRYA